MIEKKLIVRMPIFNNYFWDNAWNGGQPTRSQNTAWIGNYVEKFRDVGLSSWSSQYTYFLNNVITNAVGDGLGYNDAAWALGDEPGSSTQEDSHHNLYRNNYIRNITVGKTLGRTGVTIGGEDMTNYDIIIDSNDINNTNFGLKFMPETYTGDFNIILFNNNIGYTLSFDIYVRNRDGEVRMVKEHSSSSDGIIAYGLTYQYEWPNNPEYGNVPYGIDIIRQSANNLTFTVSGDDKEHHTDSSIIQVYHTGITADWKIDFHNGTVVDAMPYYDQITDLITLGIDWESNYVTMSIYSTTSETTTTTTSTSTTIPSGQVSISGQLMNDTGTVEGKVILYNERTNQENTSTSTSGGNYNLNVWPDTYDLQYNIFYIPSLFIKLISLNVLSDLQDIVNYVNKLSNGISFRVNITEYQEIQVYSEDKPTNVTANGVYMTEATLPLSPNEWYYDPSEQKLYMIVNSTLPTTTTTTTTTSTSSTTTTTIPSGETQINDCDSLTDWTSRYAGQLGLDTADYQEGTASITSVSASDYSWFMYDPSGTWDWSSYNTLTYWMKVNDITEGFSLQISTTDSDYWRWYFPKCGPSTANVWEKITIDLTNPDATVGSPTLSSIDHIRWINIRSTDQLWVDDIRVG